MFTSSAPASSFRSRFVILLGLVLLVMVPPRAWAAAPEYDTALARLEQAVARELLAKNITGVSIALVDHQRIVLAKGYGYADKKRRVAATGDTVYRAGSISKLFTALAVMQQVEAGRLDIDAAVTRYLPDFGVVNPFDGSGPVTLRQLMCHRSGMVRESPVGSYFDPSEPSTAQTVASLSGCALVHPPGERAKYSNSGVTVAGHVMARVAKQPFEAYQQERLLGPIGMNSSAFVADRALRKRMARGYMAVADGHDGFKEQEAPHFRLGTLPAGNLYTTVKDLGRFLRFMFAEGLAGGSRIIQPETIQTMLTPQLTTNRAGFGLGFLVGDYRGRKTFSHSGAVYGFSSLLIGLPEEQIGVVVLGNDDLAIGPVRRLGGLALDLMLETKLGVAPPAPKPSIDLDAAALQRFTGEYESESFWAKIEPGQGVLLANVSAQRLTLRPVAEREFLGDGRISHDVPFGFQTDADGRVSGFTALGRTFQRVTDDAAPVPPPEWKKLLGQYGPGFIPIVITIKHGHLYAMIENEFDYRLIPVTRTIFKMPPGMYADEYMAFKFDRWGRRQGLVLANMFMKNRR